MNRKYLIFETEPATPPSPPEPGVAPGKYRQILIDNYKLDERVNISEDTAKALLWLHESGNPGILSGDFSILEQLNIMAGSPVESFDRMLNDMLDLDSIEVPPDFEPKSAGPTQVPSPTTPTKNLTLYVGKNTSLDQLTIVVKIEEATIQAEQLIVKPMTVQKTHYKLDGTIIKNS